MTIHYIPKENAHKSCMPYFYLAAISYLIQAFNKSGENFEIRKIFLITCPLEP